MDEVVIDTNIIVKFFVNEEYSDLALRLKDSYIEGNIDVVVPSLMKYEFISALRSNKFSAEEIKLALKALDDYSFKTEEFSKKVADLTTDLVFRHSLSSYDASYVALASLLGCTFYTADDKLIDRTEKIGFIKHLKDFPGSR